MPIASPTISSFTLAITAALGIGLNANAATTAQNNLHLISVGKPIYASPSLNAGSLVDGRFSQPYWSPNKSSWAAVNLGKRLGNAMVLWSQPNNDWANDVMPRCFDSFVTIPNYEILTSRNSTNGADGIWTSRLSVADNSASGRSHLIDFGGDSWIRINFHSNSARTDSAQVSQIQVFENPDGQPDGWFFLGTSITAFSQRSYPTDSSVMQLVNARAPNLTIPVIAGGIVCIGSWEVVAGIDKYLKMAPPLPYWAIEMGTNDGWGGGGGLAVTTYANNLQTIIDSAKAHGITPMLARPPATDTSRAHWQLNSGFIRAVDSLRTKNGLAAGPDFFSYFLAHPEELSWDGVHPNQTGAMSIRRMWAQAIIASGVYDQSKATSRWVSDMPMTVVANGWGTVQMDNSIAGNALTLHGAFYAKGLGVHAISTILVPLDKKYSRFTAQVGVDDEVNGGGSVIFQVWGDGQKLFESPLLHGGEVPVPVDVSVANVSQLTLSASNGQPGVGNDHADWASARVTTAAISIKQIPRLQAKAKDFSASLRGGALVVVRASSEQAVLRLISLDGRTVFKSTIFGSNANLAIGSIPRGIYVLEAGNGTGIFRQKLVKNE